MFDGKLILNVVHRPELSPEYSAELAKHNGAHDQVLNESIEIFKIQQEIAHKYNIKTTIQMTYASLFSEEVVALVKEHHQIYGDEIALTLLGLPCDEFWKKYRTKDFCIWMFSMEDKMAIVDDVFGKFYDCFGFYPESTGSYYLDADLINYIKAKYPSVKCAVATCWEEGPKAYHTCNNSWYTLFDGGPWAPWIPSKQNTHAPAENREQDSGIVAIPHLSRDLIACYDGNGSNFGTHPQNVLRGMIYEDGQYPYLFNLIDQYRYLARYNDGYSYNMMFVGPGWMNKMGRWEAPYELLVKSYDDALRYYGELKTKGELVDLTMAEFAEVYRKGRGYLTPECALWKDILYGSEKQVFWYTDPFMRLCIDMNQGGALVDLRPYVAKLEWKVGIGTSSVQECSYPYLIQEKYRAGYFTHYAGEGTIRSCKVCYQGEEVDLCLCRTKATFEHIANNRILTLKPVDIKFSNLSIKVQTRYIFVEGSSEILTEREIIETSDPTADVEFKEYLTACYGTTEYPEDMTCVRLKAVGRNETKVIDYAYKCREEAVKDAAFVQAEVSKINTRVIFKGEDCLGIIREGYAFSPMFTLMVTKNVKAGEAMRTWLKLEKAN